MSDSRESRDTCRRSRIVNRYPLAPGQDVVACFDVNSRCVPSVHGLVPTASTRKACGSKQEKLQQIPIVEVDVQCQWFLCLKFDHYRLIILWV
jgi:hypothetical protein